MTVAHEHSVLPENAFVSGALYATGDIEIRGQAEADVECRVLRIAETGRLTGRIVAEEVRIAGEFTGEIRAGAVALASTAHISGEVWYKTLVIAPGASIESYCGMVEHVWAHGAEQSDLPDVSIADTMR